MKLLGESDNWQLRSKIHFRPDGDSQGDSRWLESAIRIWASRFSVVNCCALIALIRHEGKKCKTNSQSIDWEFMSSS